MNDAIYEYEIYNTSAPLLGLRIYGDLEFVCDTFDELDSFVEKCSVDRSFEAPLARFLRNAYAQHYAEASIQLEEIYKLGYMVRLALEQGQVTKLQVATGDGCGWDGLWQSLPTDDPDVIGGDLRSVYKACIFSCLRYEIEILQPEIPLLSVKTFGHREISTESLDELELFLLARKLHPELEPLLTNLLRAVYEGDRVKGSDCLAKMLTGGYSVRLVIEVGQPTTLRVMRGCGGGWAGLHDALAAYPIDSTTNYLDKLLDVCLLASSRSVTTKLGRASEFETTVSRLPVSNVPQKALKSWPSHIDIQTSRQASGWTLLRFLRMRPVVLYVTIAGRSTLGIKNFQEFDGVLRSATSEVEFVSALVEFLQAAFEMNHMLASRQLEELHRCGYFVRFETRGASTFLRVTRGDGGGWKGLWESLFKLDLSGFGGDLQNLLTASIVACLHGLYREGDHHASRTLVDELLAKGLRDHVIEDVRAAQESHAKNLGQSHPLVKSLATGSEDYLEFFKGKACNHPVSDFEIGTEGRVFVCCPSYLPTSIGNIFTAKSIEEIVNSRMAILIRESIQKQDFRFCRWLHCKEIDSLLAVASPNVRKDIYPIDFRLSYDTSCNLWCVTCRKEKITVKGEQREIMLKATEQIVVPMLRKAKSVTMNGYGDVFASKPCRQVLHSINRKKNPELQVNFITNAVLFTEAEWHKFSNIHDMIGTVRVSIDAATKVTYDKIRLGGDWNILMKNLKFLSRLREDGVIKRFIICFVYQRENFLEMAEFAELGRDLGCDLVIFDALLNWNTYPDEELAARSVHYSTNPLYPAFLKEVERMRKVLPEPANPQNLWLQKNGKRRTTLLSLDARF